MLLGEECCERGARRGCPACLCLSGSGENVLCWLERFAWLSPDNTIQGTTDFFHELSRKCVLHDSFCFLSSGLRFPRRPDRILPVLRRMVQRGNCT
jgi:hypothetical protein